MYRINLLPILLVSAVCFGQPTIRQTLNGPIEGLVQTSIITGQTFYAFRGIPYAEPPITGIDPNTGQQVDRRFKPPVPIKRRWTSPLKVQKIGATCMPSVFAKPNYLNQSYSENCLFLNVYIPAGGAEKKTVLVYIPGGGFAGQDTTGPYLGPDFLLTSDNVVVILTYRLGMYGFLNLNHGEYTGNMGLKDQQAGLKWVHENIEFFSGNKREILLLGQSKGGASANFHMLNRESRNYFHRSFVASGTSLNSYRPNDGSELQLMQRCTQIDDVDKLIQHLKTASTTSIAECNRMGTAIWSPTVECSNAPKAFITESPDALYASGETAPIVNTMFSFNSLEAIQFRTQLVNTTEPLLKEDPRETTVSLLYKGFTKKDYPQEYIQAVTLLRNAYFHNATSVEEIQRANVAFESERHLVDAIMKTVVLQTIANNNQIQQKTFLFRFDVDTDLHAFKLESDVDYSGSVHSDDLCYMFCCPSVGAELYKEDFVRKDLVYGVIMRSVKMITNFARTGDPSIERYTPFQSSISPQQMYCTEIDNEPQSYVMTDIMQQLHYETWREVESIYHSLKGIPDEHKTSLNQQKNQQVCSSPILQKFSEPLPKAKGYFY